MNTIIASIAELAAPHRVVFRQETIAADRLAGGELLCETLATAISPGTELAAFRGAPPLRPEVTYPRLVGYCNVGRVLAASTPNAGFREGDRILTFTSHRSHFTVNVRDVLCGVPAGVSSERAACAYFFQLGYSALLNANVRLGSPIVVIGLGVLGLAAVSMATLAGAQVYAVSDHGHARDRASAMGASFSVGRSDLPKLLEQLGRDRAHAVITTSNTWDDWRTALECAGHRACIAVLGFPGREQSVAPFNPLDSSHFYARQLRIVASGMSPENADSRGFLPFNERDNLDRILGWMSSGRLKPELLVVGECAGHKLAEAYERLLSKVDAPGTYILRWIDGQ